MSLKLELSLSYPVVCFGLGSNKVSGTKWKLCISRKFRENSLAIYVSMISFQQK